MRDRDTGHGETCEAAGRLLPEPEAYVLLERYGIPVPPWRFASTADEAARMAGDVGFPVVLKVVSREVIHKTDAGGVRVGLRSAEEVRGACVEMEHAVKLQIPGARIGGWLVVGQIQGGVEVTAGVFRDPVFGPVLMFGSGGVLVEWLGDVTFRAVPVDERDIRMMIADTKASHLLKGLRGRPAASIDSILKLLLALSRLVTECPGIREIDLNPIIAGVDDAVAVDARVIMGN